MHLVYNSYIYTNSLSSDIKHMTSPESTSNSTCSNGSTTYVSYRIIKWWWSLPQPSQRTLTMFVGVVKLHYQRSATTPTNIVGVL